MSFPSKENQGIGLQFQIVIDLPKYLYSELLPRVDETIHLPNFRVFDRFAKYRVSQ